ncbi:DNA ligase 1 (precursor), putative [Theileria annulata]|uniref:DNA ligase n=1 Tax=Theileria annulata TaxID=5874 RepID=Q4UBN2_THEAN|nr:DNA ligase 1 (precursor), putative [Theileria annulata]CAI75769.1 DNA ligase 1 (precursor), putative [Theileria annulata]|eukprot:XP_955245.1 DNA ligase 1 (precursor), putative [Theileria annulata]
MSLHSLLLYIFSRILFFNLIFNLSDTFLFNPRANMNNSLNIMNYFVKQTHKPSSDSCPENPENNKTPLRLISTQTNENLNKNLKDLFTDSSVEEITESVYKRSVLEKNGPKNEVKRELNDVKSEFKLVKLEQNDDVKNELKLERKALKKEFDDEPSVGSLFNIYLKKGDSNDDITSPRFDPALFDITPYFPSTMCGKPNNSILFSLVSSVLQKSDDIFCTGKGSRKSVLTLLSNFYRILIYYNPPDVIPVTYLLLNRIYPEYENIEVGVGDSLIIKAMSEAYSKSEQNIKSTLNIITNQSIDNNNVVLKKYEDLGLVAAASSCTSQLLLKLPENTISGVFSHFRSIASATGKNSNSNKKEIIKKLLITAKKVESKYIIRSLQQRLRIGIGLNTIFQCIADAFYLTKPGMVKSVDSGSPVDPVKVGENVGKPLSKPIGDVRTEKDLRLRYTIEDMEFSVKTAITMLPNIEKVVGHLLDNDDSEQLVEHCKITPGIPVRPMLAKPVNDSAEILQAVGGEGITFTCEYKYDGERVQIHLLKDKSINYGTNNVIRLFSRNMENLMEKYPDVVEHFKKSIKPELEECIVDCEVVPIDDENKILSFQSLSTRKRKDVDPNVSSTTITNYKSYILGIYRVINVSVRVCLYPFDILYLNGESLVTEPLSKRREYLYDCLTPIPGTLVFAQNKNFDSIEQIDDFLQTAIQDACEGLMIKTLDDKATYEPQARSNKWLKYKKDYITGLSDSVDLVPIGAFFGKVSIIPSGHLYIGKRISVFGSYLLAVYDPIQELYQGVCKTGTGFTDQALKDLHDSLQKDITPNKPKMYDVSEKMEPDVWFLPKKVWECKAADLSISPVYTAANRLNASEKGIGLRFPRFLRVREDKKPEEATTSDQIFDMYMSQYNK